MTPAELGAALVAALGSGETSESGGGPWARATVDVPADRWPDALRTARDELACDFFDWLSAVDELPGGFTIVAHLWSTTQRHGLLIRTPLPRDTPVRRQRRAALSRRRLARARNPRDVRHRFRRTSGVGTATPSP